MERTTLQQAIESLQSLLEPEQYVLNTIHSVRDIYLYRVWLKQISGTDVLISHVSQIIIDAMDTGSRMKTLECLRVLRSLTKTVDPISLSQSTVEKLFRIYQKFIFSPNDDVRWCVSVILKDKVMTDSAIDWLIHKWTLSDHILNRLLLHPTAHPRIRLWAEKLYKDNLIPHRRSELIGLLINPDNANLFSRTDETSTLVWGIFKARISRNEKITLLKKYCSLDAFASIVEIANRLKSREVLTCFLEKLRSMELGDSAKSNI